MNTIESMDLKSGYEFEQRLTGQLSGNADAREAAGPDREARRSVRTMTEPAVDLSDSNADMLYRTDGHLAYITLNRPDHGNAFSPQMKRLLEAAWTEVKRDPEIRCVIVTGAGKRHFCTGAT